MTGCTAARSCRFSHAISRAEEDAAGREEGDIAFGFTKPRFSSSPYDVEVSKSDFIAALALQSETRGPPET